MDTSDVPHIATAGAPANEPAKEPLPPTAATSDDDDDDDDSSSSDDEFGTSNPSTPGGTLLVTRQRFGGEKVRRTARPVGAAKQRMLTRQGAGLAHSKAMYAIASRQFAAVQSRR